ncbi:MAG TPA: IPT/TIG domain-containing protein, partial [Anaeromyxobacteraceae bacterium]|nr:IPT/TIG domain-containing protein [Anaeromyxobacteraceae bacterium]
PRSGVMDGGTEVTVTGTGFDPAPGGTAVTIGGIAATSVTVASATSLTCVTPAGAAGPADVVVSTSGGTATLPSGFTYLRPVPTIASISPSSGGVEGGTVLTVTGTGFDTAAGGTAVTIGGVAATAVSVSSATWLTCTTPAGAAGPADVAVSTSGGTATLTGGFTYFGPFLFAAMLSDLSGTCSSPSPTTRMEIVDLASNVMARGFDLPGTAAVTSLTVAPDGQRIFLADACSNQIHVYTPQGAKLADVAVASPRDLVLSADGSTLYVASFTQVAAVDTATYAQTGSVALDGSDSALGMALSPDGTTLAAASANGAGPAVYLFSTSPLAVIQRVPITATVPGCAVSPNDVTFTDTGRVLAWDSNCDWVYQVDVATRSYLGGSEIAYTRDSGSSFNYNNAIFYLPATGKAYGFNEASQAVVSDPAAVSGTTLGGFSGRPIVPALHPDGRGVYYSVVHRFDGGGADTLDLLDPGTGTFTRGLYTFSDATRSIRDMRVVRIQAL